MLLVRSLLRLLWGRLILIQLVPDLANYQGTILFLALGLACSVNAARNRTLHCFVTAPLGLVVAILCALSESGQVDISPALIMGVLLVGVGGAFLLEFRLARKERGDRMGLPPG